MAECKFVAREVKVNPDLAWSTVRVEPWCEVHHQPPNQSGMCPIGQIEKATEEALTKIAAAATAANQPQKANVTVTLADNVHRIDAVNPT